MPHALMCPQCNAPLTPHPFAPSVVCAYCGATVQLDGVSVPAVTFREAFRLWNAPQSYGITSWVSLGDTHWTLERSLAHGESADVFAGRRARWPTELVVLKLLRDPQDAHKLDNEWKNLQALQRSQARGADTFTNLLPQAVAHGELGPGLHAGRRASLFRWQSGFKNSLADVLQAYPQGIPPRASVWVWRRILEMLSFVHASGLVHGAVLPPHLLVQQNEHGMRLVGYGCAGRSGDKLDSLSDDYAAYYPRQVKAGVRLTPQLDLAMSARCVAAILGGDPGTASLPEAVPAALAAVVQRLARSDPYTSAPEDAWSIREELGQIADQVFGPPQFIPIVMP